jgi:D-lactate dehydrogenase (cytochrome)
VSAIVEACHERKIAITSFAGGTSLGGALAATRAGGVCIDFIKMNRVIETNEKDLDVVVQPGVGWVELNGVLEKKGLFFPVDPAPGAKIGGMVSVLNPDCYSYMSVSASMYHYLA